MTLFPPRLMKAVIDERTTRKKDDSKSAVRFAILNVLLAHQSIITSQTGDRVKL